MNDLEKYHKQEFQIKGRTLKALTLLDQNMLDSKDAIVEIAIEELFKKKYGEIAWRENFFTQELNSTIQFNFAKSAIKKVIRDFVTANDIDTANMHLDEFAEKWLKQTTKLKLDIPILDIVIKPPKSVYIRTCQDCKQEFESPRQFECICESCKDK